MGFYADYTPTQEVIAHVSMVLDFIEANPHKWNQESYGSSISATNCFMGLVIRLSDSDEKYIFPFGGYAAMQILGMDPNSHWDRCDYIALFISKIVPNGNWGERRFVTLDELRDRVSVAMNHDFRKSNITADDPVLTN